ncbi:MAG: pilus assembly PilX N-terminal domain-containing protein, partial [Desulfobulbaceae bacterium]|nr:pilus assembly PilX N-terminal domain-containing protein [Desulfobulbaceae bacterium]
MNTTRWNKNKAIDEEGFVLALSLVVMGVLVIIGAAAMQTAIFELNIAGNDARQREAFYRSDAGLDISTELLEQELACRGEMPGGFNPYKDTSGAFVGNVGLYVVNTSNPLWLNDRGENMVPEPDITDITSGKVDIIYPYGRNPDGSVTIMTVNGKTIPLLGGALQMAAGYIGKGRSAASGGTEKS